MEEVASIGSRKSDHIRINLQEDVQSGITNGLERYHFVHRAIPELDLDQVDTTTSLFSRTLSTPLLISSMTGGTPEADRINHNLALAAQEAHIAMGVGSQRIAIENPELAKSFQVRRDAPDILLFANLGAIQLNYGYGLEQCQRAVEMIQADALVLHFNCIQEALQKNGETRFSGLIQRVETICKHLSVPVIAKEVGWGFSKADIVLLAKAGVAAIDVAGAGGTSWSQVELHRAEDEHQRRLAEAFVGWGIPTTEAIENVVQEAPSLTVIASGGLRSGVDIAKCISMGATLGGLAGPFLKAAVMSIDDTIKMISLITNELRICMFATGSQNLDQLRLNKLEKK